tara:strand:- start:2393 stop:2929 length:537 start_codon:yes stop_codon:yes gene_type:complete
MAVGTWSNPYGALGGGLPSTGDISMFSSKPFGGGNMFGAILGGGLSLAGSIFGARGQAAAAQAQMDASADQMKNNIMLAREARKGNLAKFIGQNVADYGYGADLDFDRQRRASIFDSTRKRDLERAGNIADFNAMIGMQDTPAFREQKQRAFRRDLEKARVERQAAMEGMFGPIRRSA